MKKTIRRVWIFLCGISLLFALVIPVISSHMQDYYKSMIDTSPEFLDQKITWAQIGETEFFWILFLIFLLSFIITEIIIWLKSRKESVKR